MGRPLDRRVKLPRTLLTFAHIMLTRAPVGLHWRLSYEVASVASPPSSGRVECSTVTNLNTRVFSILTNLPRGVQRNFPKPLERDKRPYNYVVEVRRTRMKDSGRLQAVVGAIEESIEL